jgi:hypothetical protein
LLVEAAVEADIREDRGRQRAQVLRLRVWHPQDEAAIEKRARDSI